MTRIKVTAVISTYKTLGDSIVSDLDSWWTTKREAVKRLAERKAQYPGVNFHLCRAIAWENYNGHWSVQREQN